MDLNLVDRILQYGLGASGRHLRLRTEVADKPGGLQRLVTILADHSANIFDVIHHRIGASLAINRVELELTLEVRDRAHGEEVIAALRAAGYPTEPIQDPRLLAKPEAAR